MYLTKLLKYTAQFLQRLKAIGNYIKLKPIDVVVYMDRFDLFRTDGNDQQASF